MAQYRNDKGKRSSRYRITAEQLTPTDDPKRWVTEASTLQLKPGAFPIYVDTPYGSGIWDYSTKTPDGDIIEVRYIGHDFLLIIIND